MNGVLAYRGPVLGAVSHPVGNSAIAVTVIIAARYKTDKSLFH